MWDAFVDAWAIAAGAVPAPPEASGEMQQAASILLGLAETGAMERLNGAQTTRLTAIGGDRWAGLRALPAGREARDAVFRLIFGARTALIIGLSSAFLGCTVGAIIGAASAYFGGRIDNAIQRCIDLMLSFPLIVLALVVVAVLGRYLVFGIDINLILAIAIPIVPQVARAKWVCLRPMRRSAQRSTYAIDANHRRN